MAYAPYVDWSYYHNTYQGDLTETEAKKLLTPVSRKIDTLTFNRIVARGFDNLTDFQKDIVREVSCKMIDFEAESGALIDSAFSSYSINGVSMGIDKDGFGIMQQNGIAIPKSLYKELEQTGLCGRNI